jgi:hypothetical protein
VMGGAEIERLETAANDGFLQRTQGHIPDLRSGNTPKSLLICVWRAKINRLHRSIPCNLQ